VNGKTFLDFGDENHEGNATMLCPALYQSLTDISEVMWSLQSGKYGTECKGRHDEWERAREELVKEGAAELFA
jgi:hypothetical protein